MIRKRDIPHFNNKICQHILMWQFYIYKNMYYFTILFFLIFRDNLVETPRRNTVLYILHTDFSLLNQLLCRDEINTYEVHSASFSIYILKRIECIFADTPTVLPAVSTPPPPPPLTSTEKLCPNSATFRTQGSHIRTPNPGFYPGFTPRIC
jgi:hypothetical protein